jgi:flap endonuclease-1
MGIHGLMKVLGDHAPSSVKENEIKNFFGRKIAIDASMSLYQFLIAVRTGENMNGLTDEGGETTRYKD